MAKAICFNRLGEIRDRTSGLNLVVAAIILWNTVRLERAVKAKRDHGFVIDEALLKHVAPDIVCWN